MQKTSIFSVTNSTIHCSGYVNIDEGIDYVEEKECWNPVVILPECFMTFMQPTDFCIELPQPCSISNSLNV